MSCSKLKKAPWTRFGLGAEPCLSHRGSSGRLRGAATRSRILDAIGRLQTKASGGGEESALRAAACVDYPEQMTCQHDHFHRVGGILQCDRPMAVRILYNAMAPVAMKRCDEQAGPISG
jgi:hypothetical protein